MKATINQSAEDVKDYIVDRIYKNGLRRGYKAVAVANAGIVDLAELRICATESGTAYAAFWLYTNPGWANGTGKAAGYGYHKPSAAAQAAMKAAGVQLSDDIAGRGYDAIKDAMQAVGELAAEIQGVTTSVFVVEVSA